VDRRQNSKNKGGDNGSRERRSVAVKAKIESFIVVGHGAEMLDSCPGYAGAVGEE
jgi:hypothetical protein